MSTPFKKSSSLQGEDNEPFYNSQQLTLFTTAEKARYNTHAESNHRVRMRLIRSIYDLLQVGRHPVIRLQKTSKDCGIADLQTSLKDRCYYILVAPGNILQSEAQWKFQQSAERSGACYILVKSFDDFMEQYQFIISGKEAPHYPS